MIKSCRSKKEKKREKTYFVLLELYSYTTNPETNSWMQSNKTYSEHMP